MRFFDHLTEKPWLPAQAAIDSHHSGRTFALSKAKAGLLLFMAMVGVLFFLLIIAYAGRMAFEVWKPGPEPALLWLNTLLLVMSSVAMQLALIAAWRGSLLSVQRRLSAAGIFSFAFLIGQIIAWRQLAQSGVFDVSNVSVAFFYIITGLHAMHLTGGLIAWNWTCNQVSHPGADCAGIKHYVELCTIYWHFLLVIWLLLFGLLFSGNNLSVLLAICGITPQGS